MRKKTANRTLRAEALESRQLLHGGAIAGGGEPPTAEDHATDIATRFDANEDMELSQDEVSERLWNRISEADTDDENSTVSVEELTAHLDAADVGDCEPHRTGGSRARGGERISIEDRVDRFFTENDTDLDGVITGADEVSEELLARIMDADVDGDGVSAAELVARHEARQEARAQERFDARFSALDDNDDGGITVDEVSERRWQRISAADGEAGDGVVTAEELQTYLDAQRAEREAEREAEVEMEADGGDSDTGGEPVAVGEAATQTTRRTRGNAGRGGGGARGRG